MTAVNAAPGSSQPKKGGHDPQVAGAGDRQELRQPLHDPQHDGFQLTHRSEIATRITHRRSGKDALASGRHRQRACDRPVAYRSAEEVAAGSRAPRRRARARPATTALSASLSAGAGGRCEGWISIISGAAWSTQRRARSTPRRAVPTPGARCRSSRSGSKAKPPPSRWRAPRLSCTWKRPTTSSTGSISFEARALEVGDDVRVPDVEQHANGRRVDPEHELAHRLRVVADARAARDRPGTGSRGRRSRRGPPPSARAAVSACSSAAVSGPGLRSRARDRRRGVAPIWCAYSSRPSPARLCSEGAELQVRSGRARRCSAPSPRASGAGPAVPDHVPRVGEHLDRRRGDLDPSESGRLDRLEGCRTRPPLVRHVEAEPFVEAMPHPDARSIRTGPRGEHCADSVHSRTSTSRTKPRKLPIGDQHVKRC